MENMNPPPTSNRLVLPAVLRAQAVQELHELQRISAFIDYRLESIERFLNNFANQPNETNMNDLEFDDESDNDSDDSEVLRKSLGWHLEEIHVTWAHLEKKQTRLRLYTIYLEELESPSVDEPEPQPLPNLPFLDVNLGDKRGTNPPINPYSLGSFKMKGNPQQDLKDKEVIDSGCSRHMTGNISYLTDYEEIDGGFVAFGGNSKGGKITRKGKIRTSKLDFEDVYFVKELKFNLFSVSQMCDKKNSVFFTDTVCVVLSPDFKLTNESHVLLKAPRKDNMYSVDLKNIISQGGLTCLFAKAIPDESNLWHKKLGHVNFKTMNKLVKGNLVRGTENLIDLRVKVIRCDNRTEFKNRVMNQFCEMKGIKREFSVARTPQQNRVAERKNRTLIEAARTMLADSKLPTTFWAKAVNTACYVQNRVLVIKPHNKTPYELFLGKFDGKADERLFVGYSTNSKAFRVFNSRTRIVEENLHVQFSENTPNIAGRNKSNGSTGTKACDMEKITGKDYILLPLSIQDLSFSSSSKDSPDAVFKSLGEEEKKDAEDPGNKSGNPTKRKDSEDLSTEEPNFNQEKDDNINSTNNINTASEGNNTNNVNNVSSTVNAAGLEVNVVDPKTSIKLPNDLNMPELKDIIYSDDDEDVGAEVDINNLDTHILVSPIPTTRIHKDHPVKQIIRDIHSAPQTR
ncbi:ribonuclease H-like domain-containing protein [Tanacetum coccineum]